MPPDADGIIIQDRTRWGIVAVVLAGGIVAAAQIGKLPAALPALRVELALTLVEAGWVISTLSAVGVATGMLTGAIVDRIGAARTSIGGMALIALGSLVGSFAPGSAALIGARIVEGAGYIAVITSAPALILPVTAARDRPLALAVWVLYMPLGMSAMVALSPYVLDWVSWRGLWQINAGLGAAAAIALAAMTRRVPHAGRPAAAAGPSPLLAVARTLFRPGPPALAFAFGSYSLIYLAVMAFLPTFLIERRGTDPETAALLVAVAVFMNGPGCIAGGWLLQRGMAPWRVIALGHAGMLISAFGIYDEEMSGAVRYVLALFLPFVGGLVPPAVLARAPAHAPSPALASTAIGLVVQVISLGQLIGPPALAALVAGSGAWGAAVWLTSAAAGVGILAALIIRRLERRMPR
jgi:predicted MFS family arabinose efflux permease